MVLPLALPLAPAAGPAAASAATLVMGSGAYLAQQAYGFRRPLPPIPRVGGRAGGPSMAELIADAVAGARVGVGSVLPPPWSPPPLLVAAAGLAAWAAAQLWGLLNGRTPGSVPVGQPSASQATGLVGALGGSVRVGVELRWRQRSCTISPGQQCFGPEYSQGLSYSFVQSYGAGGGAITVTPGETRVCGPVGVSVHVAKGTAFPGQVVGGTFNAETGSWCGDIVWWRYVVEFTNPQGATSAPVLPELNVTYPDGWEPAPVPEAEPQPQPQRLLVPLPLPLVPLVSPEAVPVTQPQPQPEAEPARVPAPVRRHAPAAPPLTRPLPPARLPLVNGAVVAPVPAPIPTTDPDAIYPIPGRPPLVGNGPRANLGEIAKELGRIEAKMHGLMGNGPEFNPVPEWINDIGQAFNFAKLLYEMLTASQAGGVYTLQSPCEFDQDTEEPLSPREVSYEGANGWLEVVSNKLDALAVLQQHAKELKQPICKHKPIGQPVQVTFVEQLP